MGDKKICQKPFFNLYAICHVVLPLTEKPKFGY